MMFAKKMAMNKCAFGLRGEEYFSNSDEPTVARWLAECWTFSPPAEAGALR
jgi:hypothetical protein